VKAGERRATVAEDARGPSHHFGSRPSGACLAILAILAILVAASPSRGEDSDRVRAYIDMRFGESNPLTKAHDVGGISIGANVNRYLGFDVSLDAYDLFLDSGMEKVGEVEVLGLTPQIRLRYPLLGDRLTPYFSAGVGAAVAQLNDTVVPVRLGNGSGTSVQVAGVFGAGIEYYVADNVAVGIEGRYLLTGSESFTTQDSGGGTENLSAGIATIGLRVLYPELHPGADGDGRSGARKWYIGVLTGGALAAHHQVFPGITTDPEQGVLSSQFTQLFGLSVGTDLTRWCALELAVSAYEYGLAIDGIKVTEYSLFPATFRSRFRHPMLDGRLEPYALAGVGFEYGEVNDQNQVGTSLGISGRDVGLIGQLGTGVEYRVMSNVALDFEADYVFSRGHSVHLGDGPDLSGNLDSVLLSLGLRILFST
jgi:opacity protein-like surface antigen